MGLFSAEDQPTTILSLGPGQFSPHFPACANVGACSCAPCSRLRLFCWGFLYFSGNQLFKARLELILLDQPAGCTQGVAGEDPVLTVPPRSARSRVCAGEVWGSVLLQEIRSCLLSSGVSCGRRSPFAEGSLRFPLSPLIRAAYLGDSDSPSLRGWCWWHLR